MSGRCTDRAYESRRRRQWLPGGPGLPQASAGPPLLAAATQRPHRAPPGVGEKVFGTLKRSYGYQRVRYRGLGRNTVELWFLMAYNLRKADTLAWAAG